MENQLQNLIDTLSSKPDIPETHRVIEELKQDLTALNTGFHIALAGFNRNSLDRFKENLKSVYNSKEIIPLQPYTTITTWGRENLDIVERARILILTTTAKKLIPAILLDLIEMSNKLQIPTIYLVEEMGRMRNPKEFAGKVMAEITKVHKPALVTCHLISDDRFSGMKTSEITEFLSKKELDDRSELIRRRTAFLAQMRATEALKILEGRESTLAAESREILSGKQLLRAGINKNEVNVRLAKETIRSEMNVALTYFGEIDYTEILKQLDLEKTLVGDTKDQTGEQDKISSDQTLKRISELLEQGAKIIKSEANSHTESLKDTLKNVKKDLIQKIEREYALEVKDLKRFQPNGLKKLSEKASIGNIDQIFKQIELEFTSAIKILEELPPLNFQDKTLMEIYLKIRDKIGAKPDRSEEENEENEGKKPTDGVNKNSGKDESKSGDDNAAEEDVNSGIDFHDLIRRYGDQYFIDKTIGDLLRQVVAATEDQLQSLILQLDARFDSELSQPIFLPLLEAYEDLYGLASSRQDTAREKIRETRNIIKSPDSIPKN